MSDALGLIRIAVRLGKLEDAANITAKHLAPINEPAAVHILRQLQTCGVQLVPEVAEVLNNYQHEWQDATQWEWIQYGNGELPVWKEGSILDIPCDNTVMLPADPLLTATYFQQFWPIVSVDTFLRGLELNRVPQVPKGYWYSSRKFACGISHTQVQDALKLGDKPDAVARMVVNLDTRTRKTLGKAGWVEPTDQWLQDMTNEHMRAGNHGGAVYFLLELKKRHPDNQLVVAHLASALRALGYLATAAKVIEDSLTDDMHLSLAHIYIKILSDLGRQEEAEILLEQIPQGQLTSSDMMALAFASCTDNDLIHDFAVQWSDQVARGAAHVPNTEKYRRGEEPIRIGFVSCDFKQHPVACFLLSWLGLVPKGFEVHTFCCNIPDHITARIQSMSIMHACQGLSPSQLTAEIKAAKIDVLIDLVGHAGDHRLLTFMQRPARVQATWLGYMCTTGVKELDYWIMDKVLECDSEPIAEGAKYCLPNAWACYQPHPNAPAIRTPQGPVTFGSFQNYGKLTPATIALWSRVLQHVPDSRMLLKCAAFVDRPYRNLIMERFKQGGVQSERIQLIEHVTSFEKHLDLYGDVDISLDPVEMTGATTSCDTLYQGVPIVTLSGPSYRQRMTSSILYHAGFDELQEIPVSEAEYIDGAAALAENIKVVRANRENIRQVFFEGFCNGKQFAIDFCEACADMLRR